MNNNEKKYAIELKLRQNQTNRTCPKKLQIITKCSEIISFGAMRALIYV